MHDVYVEKDFLGTYSPITKEVALEKVNTGHYASIVIEHESMIDNEKSHVYLIFHSFTGYVSEETGRTVANEYLAYVESITGIGQRRF